MSDKEARQILIDLVHKYEEGYGELQTSMNMIGIDIAGIKGEMKLMNSKIEILQDGYNSNKTGISSLREVVQKDARLRQSIDGILNYAREISKYFATAILIFIISFIVFLIRDNFTGVIKMFKDLR